MNVKKSASEAEVLQRMIADLAPLDDDARLRMLDIVARFYDLQLGARHRGARPVQVYDVAESGEPDGHELERGDFSPKEFLVEKNPQTLVERVACLAFYLTHYRDTKHFKTFDISKLNTEAAQAKFSNTAQSVNDATKAGFLAAATRGNKQIGALGERYVQALPDREEARGVGKRMKPRKARRRRMQTKRKIKK